MANPSHMRWIPVPLAIAILLAAAPATPVEAGRPTEIVLNGKRSGFAQIRVGQRVGLECCGLEPVTQNGQTRLRTTGFTARTTGTYAGFVIERVADGRIMKMAVRVPALDLRVGRVPTFISFGRFNDLPRGRYRVHLLTDGRATVRIVADGLSSDVFLQPNRRSPVSATLIPLAEGTTDRTVQARVPVHVGRTSMVGLATKTEGDTAQAHYLSQCLTEPGGVCTDEEDYDVGVSPGSGGGGRTMIRVHPAGTLPHGPYDAVFSAGSVGLQEPAYGFVLVFG